MRSDCLLQCERRFAAIGCLLLIPVVMILVGCATTGVQTGGFSEFADAVQQLQTGADRALKVNDEQNRRLFIDQTAVASRSPDGAAAVAGLLVRADGADPFSWNMEPTPLFMMSRRFRAGVFRLNGVLADYAALLQELSSPQLMDRKHFDAMAKDLNADLAAAGRRLGVSASGRGIALFSTAAVEAFHAYLSGRRREQLAAALSANQQTIAQLAAHLQKAMRIAARNLRQEYNRQAMQLVRRLTPGAGGNETSRRQTVEELLATNEDFVARLAVLETLNDSYGRLPAAHRELIAAVQQPGFVLPALRQIFIDGKHLYSLYREMQPVGASER